MNKMSIMGFILVIIWFAIGIFTLLQPQINKISYGAVWFLTVFYTTINAIDSMDKE